FEQEISANFLSPFSTPFFFFFLYWLICFDPFRVLKKIKMCCWVLYQTIGGSIVQQAALITGCVVGGMSAVALAAPNDQFLRMGPMLGVGLGVVIAASFGGMFFPTSSLLMNVSLYGGLGVFGLFTAYDAQRVLHDAQVVDRFDPIAEQFGLYMDSINIFVRIVQILMMQNRKK
ncbi:hypothetical protein RFI_06315, partial [Reticulomyxa filosa]